MFGILSVTLGPDKGRTLTLVRGQVLYLGNGPTLTDRLTDPSVARIHCQVRIEDSKAIIQDHQSPTGTRVNGKPIQRHELQVGDLIQIGATKLTFKWSEGDEGATQEIQVGPSNRLGAPRPPG